MMSAISRSLLHWYDENARDLPWRVGPAARKRGVRPDPYRVWLSEIMLQQTTVAAVRPRFLQFIARWPTIESLANAPVEEVLSEWAGLGYYARARNLRRCAQMIVARGEFPRTEEQLRALPGVGGYTAAAIAAIAFGEHAIAIDGNIARATARLFAILKPLREAKPELKTAIGSVWPSRRSGDFAQALMDLGALVCTPRSPHCPICPLSAHCKARARGLAELLPSKAEKVGKPTRQGIAYALVNGDGEMLFERRPETGLLGGMLGLPGTDWSVGEPAPAPPAKAKWKPAGLVRHTFTHFHLELDVMAATAPNGFRPGSNQCWIAPDSARLPTVMKKAAAAGFPASLPSRRLAARGSSG